MDDPLDILPNFDILVVIEELQRVVIWKSDTCFLLFQHLNLVRA